MTLHLLKLCVGSGSIAELRAWQRECEAKVGRGKRYVPTHTTRTMPKRREEILAGGSLYWVMNGFVAARQRIVGLVPRLDGEGRPCCEIQFAKSIVPVEPRPHRPFQGWRYLEGDDAPPDLRGGAGNAPSAAMLAELKSLGLI